MSHFASALSGAYPAGHDAQPSELSPLPATLFGSHRSQSDASESANLPAGQATQRLTLTFAKWPG